MARSDAGPRLIMVCGLPGSGKTTLGKALEAKLRAVRFAPDEWMHALSIDVYDEETRAKIETLQWKLAQQLLALDLTVIIEWGTWGRSERDTLRLGARVRAAAVELHYARRVPPAKQRRMSSSRVERLPAASARPEGWLRVRCRPLERQ